MQLLHCAWLYVSHIDLSLWSALIHKLPSVAALISIICESIHLWFWFHQCVYPHTLVLDQWNFK